MEANRLTPCAHPRIFEVDHVELPDETRDRRIARNTMALHAETIMEQFPEGFVAGPQELAETFGKHVTNFGDRVVQSYLYDWVSHAWRDNGKTYFVISKHIN